MSVGKILEKRRDSFEQILRHYMPELIMPKIRPYQDGADEIVGIDNVNVNYLPYYLMVSFTCRRAFSGEFGTWHVRFNAGAIIVLLLNGQLLLRRQYRLPVGAWTYEIPRAFVDFDKVSSIDALSSVMKMENWEEIFVSSPQMEELCQLHDGVYENTGTQAVKIPIYLLVLSGEMKNKKEWKLFSFSEARQILRDLHSLTAFFLTQEKLI